VRVLNGWVSTGNHFEGNDCSYANNNGFEAWSPRNTYVRNKANHCSYGFWLGASDQTLLVENEASHNGDPKGFHNSPHLPDGGHAGIVFMFGPSSHTRCFGNVCRDNNGAGIALIGDPAKFKAFHWILQQNVLERNRWGIFLQHADWIDVGPNTFKGNTKGDLHDAGGVTNLARHAGDAGKPPTAKLDGPSTIKAGQKVTFDASASAAATRFRWDLGDGTTATTARVEHAYAKPGFYRLGVTVGNGPLSDLAWRDVYVVEDVAELGADAADWSVVEGDSKAAFAREPGISGDSVRALVEPYGGARVSLRCKVAPTPLDGRKSLVVWMKVLNPHIPAWQDANPIITLWDGEKTLRLTPQGDFLSNLPYIEAREGWVYFEVPLAGDKQWKREGAIDRVTAISIGVDSWGAPPLRLWFDGLALK